MDACCTECFSDTYLRERIEAEGSQGDCDFCGHKNVFVVQAAALREYFTPLIELYTADVDFMGVEDLKESEGRFIWEILTEDWEVFPNADLGHRIIQAMFTEGQGRRDVEMQPAFLDAPVSRELEYYGMSDEESGSLIEQWDEFCNEVKFNRRFFPHAKWNPNVLDELLPIIEITYAQNDVLFRARLSEHGDEKWKPGEMGPPPREKSRDGRANPRGIPYLYLASDWLTAISELRPQLGSRVTVGKFAAKTQLRLVNLARPFIDSPFRWGKKLESVVSVLKFLGHLGSVLSRPVNEEHGPLEYLPSQYLCELLRDKKFDGVLYGSFRAKGDNIVLFDKDSVECLETWLCTVTKVDVTAEAIQ